MIMTENLRKNSIEKKPLRCKFKEMSTVYAPSKVPQVICSFKRGIYNPFEDSLS